MKVLLTGNNGQLGWELARSLGALGEVFAFDRNDLDLAVPDAVVARVREIRPELIVNAAAYTAVDLAEREPQAAHAVNGRAPGILAEETKRLDALLVHYSTDYVFDGQKEGPYTEEDAPKPLNVYGRSKLEGERAVQASGCRHLILRTSWIYGARGKNFLLTILRLAKEKGELRVVDDQFGAPTWCRSLAAATVKLLDAARHGKSAPEGLFHCACAGHASWYGFARAVLEETASAARVFPIPTEAYRLPARRPRNSLLDCRRLAARFGVELPDWREALRECVRELKPR